MRKWLLLLVVLGAGAYWISVGTPSPDLVFAPSLAKEECVRLAEENREHPLIGDGEISTGASWLKDSLRVVQLIIEDGGDTTYPVCVFGRGMVQIPSMLEQSRWR